VDVVDLVNGGTLGSIPFAVHNIAISSSLRGLICWSDMAGLHFWDLAKGKKTWSLSLTNLPFEATRVACSPDGRRLALAPTQDDADQDADLRHDVALLESGSGRVLVRTNLPWVSTFGFSSDSRFLVVGDYDGGIHVWSAETGSYRYGCKAAEPIPGGSLREILSRPDTETIRNLQVAIPVTAVGVSPDGSGLAIAAGIVSAELTFWNMATGDRKWFVPLGAGVRALAFSPDGARLAVARGLFFGSSAGVVIFDVAAGQELLRLNAAVESLAFSPDGTRLWGVTPKRSLVYWDATPWPGPITPPAVALKPSVVESLQHKNNTNR